MLLDDFPVFIFTIAHYLCFFSSANLPPMTFYVHESSKEFKCLTPVNSGEMSVLESENSLEIGNMLVVVKP